jgi:hypothetical protein
MKNECLEIALRELEAVGVRDIDQAHGSKHLQLRWRVNGRDTRVYTLPCTPSDVRSSHNVRADIRRLLREDGVQTATPKSPVVKQPDRFTLLERRVAALERDALRVTSGENGYRKASG